MQCPKCQYEPTMREQQDSPEQCPSCGVYYAKMRAGADNAAVDGVAAPFIEAAQRRQVTQHFEQANRQKVVVVDLDMPFLSMVVFMVKWVLASIPALIILFLIFGFLYGLLSGLVVFLEYRELARLRG